MDISSQEFLEIVKEGHIPSSSQPSIGETMEMFEKYPLLEKLELTVKKPEAPVNEDFEYVGIKIIRSRSDYIK